MSTPQSPTTPANPPSDGPLDEVHLSVRARIAAAWTSFMFLYVYVDHLALYKPGHLEEIRGGSIHGIETGPTFVSLALTSVAVSSLMVVLSATLPARVTRTLNLVVATLFIPYSIVNAAGESASYAYFYGFSIGLEVLLLAFILRSAWTWPRRITPGR